MKIDLVTHCWRYSKLLRYQLSSLYLYPPTTIDLTAVVFCAAREEDPATWRVLDFFLSHATIPRVSVSPVILPSPQLFRRSIGRNIAAHNSPADWLWFTDCDMTFGPAVWDALGATLPQVAAPLVFPRSIQISRTHAVGDAAIERASTALGMIDVCPDEFAAMRYRRAIGGVQITRGDVARSKGYCPQDRWQRPADRWQRAREDVAFRRSLGTRGTPIDVPNIYRIRHSVCGRMHFGVEL